jgi:hypothetical protein
MMFRRPIYRPLSVRPYDPLVPAVMKIAATCPDCDGRRQVAMQLPGRPDTARMFNCETCKGTGEIIER